MPAYEACRLYRARPDFQVFKGGGNTFGEGLSEEQMVQLRAGGLSARQDVIQSLVKKWIGRRLDW